MYVHFSLVACYIFPLSVGVSFLIVMPFYSFMFLVLGCVEIFGFVGL